MSLNLEEIKRAREEADCLADAATVEAALERLLGRRRPVPLHREDPALFRAPTNPGHS